MTPPLTTSLPPLYPLTWHDHTFRCFVVVVVVVDSQWLYATRIGWRQLHWQWHWHWTRTACACFGQTASCKLQFNTRWDFANAPPSSHRHGGRADILDIGLNRTEQIWVYMIFKVLFFVFMYMLLYEVHVMVCWCSIYKYTSFVFEF